MWRLAKRNLSSSLYFWSKKIVKTPSMGESITEGTLTQWHKKIGDIVKRDEQVATIETDKVLFITI
jgi:2-oxoglutarate dehydrogenase E2 component (dihydrolipoamide succinyltransferase)